MIRLMLTAVLLLQFFHAFAQTEPIKEKLLRVHPSCMDVAHNASLMIPEYHERRQLDSVETILNLWEQTCGFSEELLRCRILLAIEQDRFSEELYDHNIIERLLSYKTSVSHVFDESGDLKPLEHNLRYLGYAVDLTKYTTRWARNLLMADPDPSPLEHFFLRFYGNDFNDTFSILNNPEYDGTKLQASYQQQVVQSETKHQFRGEVQLGAWVPSGQLDILGPHAGLGVRAGVQTKRFYGLLSLKGYFGDTPDQYVVNFRDSLWYSNEFTFLYAGLDVGYKLKEIQGHNFELIGGIGYNAITVLRVPKLLDPEEDDTEEVNSLNLNFGLAYRFQFESEVYIGLEAKYHAVNFANSGGTNLGGHFVTLDLAVGFISQDYNSHRRRLLGVND